MINNMNWRTKKVLNQFINITWHYWCIMNSVKKNQSIKIEHLLRFKCFQWWSLSLCSLSSTFKISSTSSTFSAYTQIIVSILVKKKIDEVHKKKRQVFTYQLWRKGLYIPFAPGEIMDFFLRWSFKALTPFALGITSGVFFI